MSGVPPFWIRRCSSGQRLAEGPIGNVPTSLGPGLGWSSQPQAGGGGSVDPLAGVRVVDDGSASLSPTGAFSQSVAFPTLQGGLDDLGAGGTIFLAGGTYDSDIIVSGAFVIEGNGGSVSSALASTINGIFVVNAGEVTFENVVMNAVVLSPAARVSCVGTVQTDSVSCSVLGLASGASFAGPVTCFASGTSTVRSSTFADGVQFDKCDCFDADFAGDVSGGSGANDLTFRQSILRLTCQNDITCDGVTELRSLKAGLTMLGANIRALDAGQGGSAVIISGNVSLNFTGPRRGVVCRNGAAAVVTLATTGAKAGEMFYVDMYATANTTTVKFGGVTIGPSAAALPVQAAGTGTRYGFQVTSDTAAIVYAGATAL